MDIAAFLTHLSNKITSFPKCVGNDRFVRSAPLNLGERRPKINSACAIISHPLSKCSIDGCFKLLERPPDALAWNSGKVISIAKGKDPSPSAVGWNHHLVLQEQR